MITSIHAPRVTADRHEDPGMDSETIVLPDAWTPPDRPPLPIAASVVPVVGAVVLWLVTGSMLSLLLAGLGPVVVAATILDGRRAARRDRRRSESAAAEARSEAESVIRSHHQDARRRMWARHPDVAATTAMPNAVWRSGRRAEYVIGAGAIRSGLRVIGGAGDPQSLALRERAARLQGAPILVAAERGVAVVGSGAIAAAVHRALAVQLCTALAPGDLRIVGCRGEGFEWAAALPHRGASAGLALALVGPGDAVPDEADAVLALAVPGEPLPRGCGVTLTVRGLDDARLDDGDGVTEVAVEALSVGQARAIAEALGQRSASVLGRSEEAEQSLPFAALQTLPTSPPGSLPIAIGRSDGEPAVIDLVQDGPHAVVAGVTGAGKSELLITWILGLARAYSTAEVSFLLADFKGGTAFDALRDLPHVTGVITDLDGGGALRAMQSLRAEVRWREGELARVGARDAADARAGFARLVIVVDELAAMLAEHPELHALLADVAARGRALGMHLVLGTQRISGVIRDGLLANCPLRISLRVTEAADSRAVIGDERAALLPGDAAGRGVAFVRRARDAGAHRTRIALTSAADVARVRAEAAGEPPSRRPWLPELPTRIELASLPPVAHGLRLGLADEPEHQRQRTATIALDERGLLVVGGPASGKTTALRTLAHEAAAVIWVPSTGEGAWDAIAELVSTPPPRGTLVVVDDLDTLAARVTPEHAHELIDRLEQVMRGAGASGLLVAAGVQRLGGPVSRLADLLHRRLILGATSKVDHLAAGGDPAHFAAVLPPGRGRLDGVALQVAVAPPARRVDEAAPYAWSPTEPLSGLVTRRPGALAGIGDAWAARGIRCTGLDDYAAAPSIIADGPVVVVGDPDEWQRHWRLLASLRRDHDLVVDLSCAGDLRALTGSRALPPYAEPGRERAWLLRAGAEPRRIVLAATTDHTDRPDRILDPGQP